MNVTKKVLLRKEHIVGELGVRDESNALGSQEGVDATVARRTNGGHIEGQQQAVCA
jgi:hypothetical protein